MNNLFENEFICEYDKIISYSNEVYIKKNNINDLKKVKLDTTTHIRKVNNNICTICTKKRILIIR